MVPARTDFEFKNAVIFCTVIRPSFGEVSASYHHHLLVSPMHQARQSYSGVASASLHICSLTNLGYFMDASSHSSSDNGVLHGQSSGRLQPPGGGGDYNLEPATAALVILPCANRPHASAYDWQSQRERLHLIQRKPAQRGPRPLQLTGWIPPACTAEKEQ